MENKKIIQTTNVNDILDVESTLSHNILSKEMIQNDIKNNTYNYSVIIYDKKIAGYIAFSNCIDHIDLISVAIKPNFRRLGLAKDLINYMESLCVNQNISNILLEVRKSNLAAISLYESLNYKKISTRKNYYTSPLEDAIIYMKQL